jgi:hypothetical protein
VAEALETVRQAESAQAEARQAVAEMRGQSAQLAALNGRMARGQQDLADLRSGLSAAQTRLGGFDAILARRSEIEKGWEALKRPKPGCRAQCEFAPAQPASGEDSHTARLIRPRRA